MHLSSNGLNAKFGNSEFQINGGGVRFNGNGDRINISKAEGLSIYGNANGHSQEVLIIDGNKIELANAGVTINSFGINFLNRKDGDIPTAKASFININDYALKTELPTVPTTVSQLTNDSNFITAVDVDLTPYATTEELTAVDQKVDAKQDKIVPKPIDVTGIETASIEQLRTIVNNLVNALAASGLVSADSGIE